MKKMRERAANGGRMIGLPIGVVAAVALGACGDLSTPPIQVVDPDVELTVAAGAPRSDSARAEVVVVFEARETGSENPPIENLLLAFGVAAEDCGEVLTPSVRTDADGLARARWRLGSAAGKCKLGARALNSAGGVLGAVEAELDVLAAQAAAGWIRPGAGTSATGALELESEELLDQWGNPTPWGLRVVNGPARVLGQDPSRTGARTLVPEGHGSGSVEIYTRWGAWVTVDLRVCPTPNGSEIRLHWTTPEAPAVACPPS